MTSGAPSPSEIAPSIEPAPPSARWHALFATSVWVLMCCALVRQVLVYGTRVPFYDDWLMGAVLRPDSSIGSGWYWWVHNEHRIPLAKAIYIFVVGTTHDARAGTFVTVALLASTARACMWMARTLRGRAHFTDAFFPLLWMHGGQSENVLNSFQVAFAIPAALTAVGLVLVSTTSARPSTKRVIGVGLVAFLMPLTGGVGLPQVVAWCAWLAIVFASSRRSPDARDRRAGFVALAFVVCTVALTAWYFVDYTLLPGFKPPGLGLLLEVAGQFLTRSAGETAISFRPIATYVLVALLAAALAVLVRAARTSPTNRMRAVGIATAIAAMIGTALAVAYGRARDGDGAGLLERYGMVSAPMGCALFAAAALFPTRLLGRGLALALFAIVCASAFVNFRAGERAGQLRRAQAEALELDLAHGLTLEEISAKRWRDFSYDEKFFVSVMRDFEAARVTPFCEVRHLAPKPPFDMLFTAPTAAVPDDHIARRRSAGEFVLLVKRGTALRYALDGAQTAVSATFGVHAELAARTNAPVMRFRVELEAPAGTVVVLFERTLDPARNASERTPQPFTLTLPHDSKGGELRFVIEQDDVPPVEWGGFWSQILVR